MLQHMVAKDHIKSVVPKRNLVDIHLYIGQRRFDVTGDVVEVLQAFEAVNKTSLRSNMQYLLGSRKKIGFRLQKQPDQPVPFQRQATWTQGVFPGLTTIGQKFLIGAFTDRALHLIAPIEHCEQRQKAVTDTLEVFSGNVPDHKTDDRFHLLREILRKVTKEFLKPRGDVPGTGQDQKCKRKSRMTKNIPQSMD